MQFEEATVNQRCGERPAPPRTSRVFWQFLAAIAVTKVLLLFVVLPAFQHSSPEEYQIGLFPDGYDAIAQNLLEGHGYRMHAETSETLMRTPGYALILAGIFAIAGKSLFAVQGLNLALSLAAGWGLYRLALRITASQRVAIVASGIFLLYPATIFAESRGGVEAAFTACAILFMTLFYRAIATLAYRDFIFVGLVFGVALLIKSTLALVLPALFVYMLVSRAERPPLRRLVALFAAASIAASLVMSPWIIRNYRISGEFIPTSTLASSTAFYGLWVVKHSDEVKPHWRLLLDGAAEQAHIAHELGLRFRPEFFPVFYSVHDEIRFSDELRRRTATELLSSPQLALRFVARNFVGFWVQGRTAKATLLNAMLVIPFLVAALIGVVVSFRRNLRVGPVIVLIVAYVVPHLPILGVARYHVPLVPFLAMFASLATLALCSSWASFAYRRRATTQPDETGATT